MLITGAAGFVGTYLCRYLPTLGWRVLATSRRVSPSLPELFPECEWHTLDVMAPTHQVIEPKPELIVHLATANNIRAKEVESARELSLVGAKSVLALAREWQVRRVVHASTIHVYGELSGHIDEASPTRPENDYAKIHVAAEEEAISWARKYGIPLTITRLANGYGRYLSPTVERWSLVPACFCKEAFESGRITLLSSGRQMRDWISMKNVALAIDTLLRSDQGGVEIFNIASGESLSVRDIAGFVKRVYEARYHKPLELIIESSQPESVDGFRFATRKLDAAGYRADETEGLEAHIHGLFELLEQSSHRTA